MSRPSCIWNTVLLLLLTLASALGEGAGLDRKSGGLRGLDGSPARVFSEKGEGFLAFVFVRTDCPISNAYAPEVRRLCKRFSSQGVRFWIVYQSEQSAAEIRQHFREYDYPCDALRDTDFQFTKRAKVRVTPEAALFRATGELLYHGRIDDRYVALNQVRPKATRRDFEAALIAAIEGKPLPSASGPAVGCLIEGAQ
jgi:hypothetical protein